MKTVTVKTGKKYDVTVGSGLIKNVGFLSSRLFSTSKAIIVCDKNVFNLYGKTVSDSFESAGFKVKTFEQPEGEKAKSFESYENLLCFLSENKITKTDLLVSLGGGATSDLTGFAAATYLRGINYISVPTTLLAAVDASVGGKTGINLSSAKNQVGAFYQPSAVFCDTDTFKTLNDRDFNSGMAEIIKCGVINSDIFRILEEKGINKNEEELVSLCVSLKSDIVSKDEFDSGVRQVLNLGHTVGHAVEKCSDYFLSHGEAVSVGLSAISRYAAENGYCTDAVMKKIINMLKKYSLPVSSDLDKEAIFTAVQSDKKIRNGKLNLIIPRKIGKCDIVPSDIETVKKVIDYV